MSAAQESVLLQTCLDETPHCYSNWLNIPLRSAGPAKENIEILKKILSAAVKNKWIRGVILPNLVDNVDGKELSEAINSQEFQAFLSSLIKENSENLNFMGNLLRELCARLKLSEAREQTLQDILLQVCLETIPRQNSRFVIPRISVKSSKDGIEILKKILSPVMKNINILEVDLQNLVDNKELSEAINSEEFQTFLIGLIKENSERFIFLESFLRDLHYRLKLPKDTERDLQSVLLQTWLDTIPRQSWRLIIPKIGVESAKDGVEILKKILSVAVKNKNIQGVDFWNFVENKELSEAVNSEEFQVFLTSFIKENSERLGFMGSLLRDLRDRLKLSKEREQALQNVLLQTWQDTIPHQSGWLVIPKIDVESAKDGIDILKKILSAAVKNKNIQTADLQNLVGSKELSEAINSEEFQVFLSSLIKENSERLGFMESLLRGLRDHLKLSKEREQPLQNVLLQIWQDTIPNQSGWLVIPKVDVGSAKNGIDILKKLLSAAVKNKNIQGIDLRNFVENKELPEAINSEEFQVFLSLLIKENSERLGFMENFLRSLCGQFKLSKEREQPLQNILLQTCLDTIPHQSGWLEIPRIGVESVKDGIDILKKILSAAVKNKNVYVSLQNLSENKELSEAINSEEFQAFLSSLIKENSERLDFMGSLLRGLRDRLKLSKEREQPLQNVLLQTWQDTIPHQSGWLVIPEIDVASAKDGIDILKKILSAAVQNKNIQGVDLRNIRENKELSEAINSEEFQAFLSSLIKENNENLGFMESLLSGLHSYLKLPKDKEEILRNKLVIAAIVPLIAGRTNFNPNIVLNSFFKYPLDSEALLDKLTNLDPRYGYRYYPLVINVTQLGKITLEEVADFFKNTRFPRGVDSIEIVSENVLDDCKTIIQLLEIMKKANIKGLRLQGAFGTLPFKQFEMLIQSVLKTPWVEKLSVHAAQLECLKDEELLTCARWLRQSKKLSSLTLTGNKLEARPVSFLAPFVAELVQISGITDISLWDWRIDRPQISEAWSEEERREFVNLHLHLIPKGGSSLIPSSPISGLVSKQEECGLLCQLMKDNPDNDMLGRAIMRWAHDFSEAQRFSLAEQYLKSDGYIESLKEFNLISEQRLELFLRYGSKFLIDQLCGFGKFPEGDSAYTWLAIFDCEFSGRLFIDAWKEIDNNLRNLEEDLEGYDLDQLKTEAIETLIPALEKASQTVWKGNLFYRPCFEQIKKQFGKHIDSDPFTVYRSVQLLQWYTWLMSRLAKLEHVEVATLSAVLKELAGYPDRSMRYKLSEALLLLLETRQGQDFYKALIKKKQGSSLFLPEILLAGIVLDVFAEKLGEEKERKESLEQAEFLKTAQEISALFSNKYDNGHYMRALISSIHVLSQTKTLTSKQKLLLIKNLLQPNPQFLAAEKALLAYFKSLKGKSVQSEVVKEALTKLLGDHSAKILAGFSKYFPKDASKELKPREINALSRGVLEKFRQFEHEKAFREQLSNWYLVEGLTLLDEIAVLTEKTPEQYGKTLYEIFQKIFKLGNEQMSFYKDTFAGQRNETAVLTYLGKIRSLKQQDRKAALEETFQGIVKSLLTEHQSLFYQERYDTRQSEHLRVVFESRPDLRERWPQNQCVDFNTFLRENNIVFQPFKPDYAKFLVNKIYHNNHLNAVDYPLLGRYLDNIGDEKIKAEVKEILEKELKSFQEMPVEERAKNSKIELRLQLQFALIRLVESGKVEESEQTIKNQKKCITEALGYLRKLHEGLEFSHDLMMLLKNFSMTKRPLDLHQSKDWRIVFTDHYWSLFMSGTDVEGSCQRVDGDPKLNQCLAAYVRDGKIKMIAIQDGAGKTIARCIFRSLLGEKDRTSVLYLEESYPHFLKSEQMQAIERFAALLAEDLNCPLVSASSTENSVKYPNSLVSLSGIGPEYVDAIYQATEDGVFSIPHSQILFRPSLGKTSELSSPDHFTWQKIPMLPASSDVKKLGEISAGGVERKQRIEEDTVVFERVSEKLGALETKDRKELSEIAVSESIDRLQPTRSPDLAGQFQSVISEFNQPPFTSLSFGVSEGEALLQFSDSSCKPALLLSNPSVTAIETGLKSQIHWSRKELTKEEWDVVLSMAWGEPNSEGRVQTTQKMTSKEADAFKEKLVTAGIDVNVTKTVGNYKTKEYQVEIPQEAQLALTELYKESVARQGKAKVT